MRTFISYPEFLIFLFSSFLIAAKKTSERPVPWPLGPCPHHETFSLSLCTSSTHANHKSDRTITATNISSCGRRNETRGNTREHIGVLFHPDSLSSQLLTPTTSVSSRLSKSCCDGDAGSVTDSRVVVSLMSLLRDFRDSRQRLVNCKRTRNAQLSGRSCTLCFSVLSCDAPPFRFNNLIGNRFI